MSILTNSGRKPKSADEVGVTIRLPRTLLDRVERFAIEEIHMSRADAIRDLLTRGLATTKSEWEDAKRELERAARDAWAGRA